MSTFELPSAPFGAIVRAPSSANETSHVARLLWLRSLFGDSGGGAPMHALAGRMTEFFLPRGMDLFTKGTTSDSIYFIVEGTVRHGTHGYTRYVTGDVLGFVDSMIDRPHVHTATVLEDAVILRLRTDDWLEHLEEHFGELRRMITGTADNMDAHPDPDPEGERLRWARELYGAELGAAGDLVRRILALKTSPLFQGASIQAVTQLLRRGDALHLREKESLAEERKRPGLWILVSGAVHLKIGPDNAVVQWSTSTPGALLGALSVLERLPFEFEIAAEADTEILFFDAEDFFDVMEDHFDVARSTLSYVAARTEQRNKRRGLAEHNDDS